MLTSNFSLSAWVKVVATVQRAMYSRNMASPFALWVVPVKIVLRFLDNMFQFGLGNTPILRLNVEYRDWLEKFRTVGGCRNILRMLAYAARDER